MKINLGYVALPVTIAPTSSSIVTYTYYQKLGEMLGNQHIHKVILSNFDALEKILYYNYKNEIHFFRLTSNLIPLATHPQVTYECYETYRQEYLKIGNLIKQYRMRVDFHPDQFCVLNSTRSDVILSSIRLLEHHMKVMEMMGLDIKVVLHVGGGTYGKKAGMNRFMKTFRSLDPKLQSRIIIENDDKLYNAEEVLELCQMLKIPMVLDYHHHLCNPCETSITMLLPKIYETWKDEMIPPKIHYSSPKSTKEYRSHSDYINDQSFIEFLNLLQRYDRDVDIMLEVKEKDSALFRLIRQLKYQGIDVRGTTIYLDKNSSISNKRYLCDKSNR